MAGLDYWLADARRGQETRFIKRFAPTHWTVNFPRPMMASVVTTAPDAVRVDAVFYGSGDLAGLIWDAVDGWSHPLLAYETARDFRDCVLRFRWRSGGVRRLDETHGPTLTIEGRDASGVARAWYVRLWNYASGEPEDAETVALLADDMDLFPADEAGLAQGRNLCLVGRELIQFAGVEALGAGRYRLSGLRRGLRGTEWAMAGHEAGEAFLLIEEDRLVEPLTALGGQGEIGAMVEVRAVGRGDVVPVAAALTIGGDAVMPPSPVHLTARATADGWAFGWTRRSRNGWRWASGGDVPLGEESERYAVTVLDGGAVVRAAESTVPQWQYDAAMIAADGVAGRALVLDVRQVGTRATGRAARIDFTA